MTAAERYERACLDYLRLALGGALAPMSELARIQALRRPASAIMAVPGGRA